MHDYIEQAAGFIIYNTQYRSTAVHTNEKLWNHTGAEDPPDAGHVGERPERPEGEPVLHTPQFVPLMAHCLSVLGCPLVAWSRQQFPGSPVDKLHL